MDDDAPPVPTALPPRSISISLVVAAAGGGLVEAGVLRLASLLLYHELAYALVGLSLFGLAMGALWAGRATPRRNAAAAAAAAAPIAPLLAAGAAAALVAAITLPRSDLAWGVGVGVWPFFAFGAVSARLFSRYPTAAARRRLYALELAGVCAGLVALAPALVGVGGGAGLIACGAAAFAAAASIGAPSRASRLVAAALVVAASALAPHLAVRFPSPVGVARHLDAALARLDGARVHHHASIWARTDLVVPRDAREPALLFTDAMHVARALAWDPAMAAAPRFDDPAVDALVGLRRAALAACGGGDVLVLGAGGGFEAAIALQAGARSVDAVEVNAAMPALLRAHAPTYAGVLDDARVRWHIAEGRRFMARQVAGPRRWRCVLFGLVETEPAALRGRAHVDGRLLTVEGLRTARRLLAPGGVVAVLHNEAALGAASRAALAAAFGADATLAATLPASMPADGASIAAGGARVLVAASEDAASRAALAAAAGARGASAGPAASDAPAPTDDRPFLVLRRAGAGARVGVDAAVALGLACAGLLAFAFAGGRRRRGGARVKAPTGRRAGLAALLAGFGGALVQMVASAHAAAFVGAPALAAALAVAACLVAAGVGAALARPPRRRRLDLAFAALTIAALTVAAPLGGVAATLAIAPAVALAAALAFAAALAAGAAFARALDACGPDARAALALDGVGALLAAAAMAALAPQLGLRALGACAGLALGAALVLATPSAVGQPVDRGT